MRWALDEFGRQSAAELELISTIIYADREAVPDADTLVHDIDDAITELLEGTHRPAGQRRETSPR